MRASGGGEQGGGTLPFVANRGSARRIPRHTVLPPPAVPLTVLRGRHGGQPCGSRWRHMLTRHRLGRRRQALGLIKAGPPLLRGLARQLLCSECPSPLILPHSTVHPSLPTCPHTFSNIKCASPPPPQPPPPCASSPPSPPILVILHVLLRHPHHAPSRHRHRRCHGGGAGDRDGGDHLGADRRGACSRHNHRPSPSLYACRGGDFDVRFDPDGD